MFKLYSSACLAGIAAMAIALAGIFHSESIAPLAVQASLYLLVAGQCIAGLSAFGMSRHIDEGM